MKDKEELAAVAPKAKSKPKQQVEHQEDDPAAALRGEEEKELRKKELLERNRFSAMRSRNKRRERFQRVEMDAKRIAVENDILRQSQWPGGKDPSCKLHFLFLS